MSRLDRYILREILAPLVVSIGVVVAAVFLFQARRLATAALGLGLELEDGLVIFVSALPPFLTLAVPIAYLLSVLVALGRLSQDLELTAMLAAGMSPLRTARAPMLLGALVAALTVPVAIYGEPYGLRLLHDRLVDVGLRNLTRAAEPGVFNEDFRGSAMYAAGRDEHGRLAGVLLYDEREHERPVLVSAEAGRLAADPGRGVELVLERGELHAGAREDGDTYDRVRFEEAHLGLDAEREIGRRTQFVSVLGRMTQEELRAEVTRLGPGSPLGRRIEKTYWRRWAFPSMAFVLGVVAAAIGLSSRARSRGATAILGMCSVVFYYVLTRIADFVVVTVEGTAIPMTFGPNLLLLGLGLLALVRAGGRRGAGGAGSAG